VAAATSAVVEVAPHCVGGVFAQVLRVYALERTHTHEGVKTATSFVGAAHLLAAESAPVRLRSVREPAAGAADARLPATYLVDPDDGPVEIRLPAHVGAGSLYDGWSPRQRPGGGATPEVLRFHLLTDEVAAAAWYGIAEGAGIAGGHHSAAGGEGEADAAADMFPLVLSPREQQLVARCLREDLLVLGRGGTGKTTVTVHAVAKAAEEDPDARVLFLTVNRNLCKSVWLQVASLRRGTELAEGVTAVVAATAARVAVLPKAEDRTAPPAPAAMCDTADAAWWPLSMSSRAWLLALDASLNEPFLRREPFAAGGGTPRIAVADAAFVAAILGTGGSAALDMSPAAATAVADDPTGPAQRRAGSWKTGGVDGGGGRVFAGFDFWKLVHDKQVTRSRGKGLGAGALWTEFCTHIKGSRGALAAVGLSRRTVRVYMTAAP